MRQEIILVDIDGTLTNEVCFTEEECVMATPRYNSIAYVNQLHNENFIVIYTARRQELYFPTITWLKMYGVKYHAIQFGKIPGKIFDLDAINETE